MLRELQCAVPSRSDERGMAMAMAVFALVVLGAMVSGAFIIGRYNQSAAANSVYSTGAQSAADAGLAAAYATWDPTVHSVLPIWDGTTATVWSSGWQNVAGSSTMQYVDSVRRLNNQLFLVQSTGRQLTSSGAVLAELTTGQLFRLAKPTIGVNAAVTVQDPLTLNGNSFEINGFNSLPEQWSPAECDPLDSGNSDDVVGVRSAVGTGIGTQDHDNVFGFPSRDAPDDPTVTSATFQDFLDYTYATLSVQPGVKTLPLATPYNGVGPVLDGSGACDKTAALNFGEPFRNPPTSTAVSQCYGFFPIVQGTASETKFAAGTRGQGTLLIDGDLELVGGFEWVGLVIIRGEMKINGNGNKITGAVLAEGVNVLTSGSVSGNVDIHYSACAIEKAIGGATVARPLGQRAYTQLY